MVMDLIHNTLSLRYSPRKMSFHDWVAKSRNWGCARQNVYSRKRGTVVPNPSSSSTRVLHLISAEIRCWQWTSSHYLKNCIMLNSTSKHRMILTKCFHISCRKRFQSCTLSSDTLVNIRLTKDKLTRVFSPCLRPIYWHQLVTAP